ncbi:MAG TPA: AAA family ATPase [Pirellulaceae bacterium]|nr:AAA family ATPase [Pirellulaceae bacterium]
MAAEFDTIVQWLTTCGAYPHNPATVERIETHISCVYLAGDQVYKLKKPVQYDFLDFSTCEKRKYACHEELRLNRRLAPQAYLDVVPITRSSDNSLQIGGGGEPLDWLVHMWRLPTDQMLDSLHRRGELRREQIDRLAEVLIDFYHSLEPLPISADEYRARLESHVRGNLRELMAVSHHLPPRIVERTHAFQLQLLKLRPEMFDQRVAQGRIVEGHGDLRPEHICLIEPPAIFDCIEFNAGFRQLDVADELAFLAAECDILGAEWVGLRLLEKYRELSGDQPLEILLDFYKSYRACVRGKVAALRADQLSGKDREAAAAEALRHVQLADRCVSQWARPLVLIVGGLSGTGKSTLAGALAESLGAELLRTDVIRRETIAVEQPQNRYSAESRQRVYDAMFDRASRLHAEGLSVVLDGTFGSRQSFVGAVQIAKHPRTVVFAVECECPPEVARERISRRLARENDPSEARPDLPGRQQQNWEAWPADVAHVRIDTLQTIDEQVRIVQNELAGRWTV